MSLSREILKTHGGQNAKIGPTGGRSPGTLQQLHVERQWPAAGCKAMFRRALVAITLPLIKLVCRLAFSGKYLRGRHFTASNAGWRWAWRSVWLQKVLGFNRHVPWPVSPFQRVLHPESIEFNPDDLNNFQSHGCYFSNAGGGRIVIGKGTYIAPNVGIITTNHDPENPDRHLEPQEVVIGQRCWLGMNSVILPGVVLGDHTVVAAGSVVGRSFPKGRVILVGVPARISQGLGAPKEPGLAAAGSVSEETD